MGAKKSESAFVMAMDVKGFSALPPAEHDKVIEHLYPEIARIVKTGGENKLLDKKTIGDGFMFYFESADDAVDAAMALRTLFRENYFWSLNKLTHLSCRIGLHAGQVFRMYDAVEERDALFGRNIITVARLEPVVRPNEVWCTASFKAEADLSKIDEQIKFEPLGSCQLAKGWSQQTVFGLYKVGEQPPEQIQLPPHHRIIYHDNDIKGYPYTYFALVRLKHRSDGIEYLKKQLSKPSGFNIEAIYDLFGAYDILVRFKAEAQQNEKDFSAFLVKGRIMWSGDQCILTEIHFESEALKSKEPIVALPVGSTEYIKAFTYIKSSIIAGDSAHINEVVSLAQGACGNDNGVVTFYLNRDTLILPIVIPASEYYALAKAVENIETFVDQHRWEHVSIITYPVHGLDEMFPEGATK